MSMAEELPRMFAPSRQPISADDVVIIRKATRHGFMVEILCGQSVRESVAFSNIQDLTMWLNDELGDGQRKWFNLGSKK